jgi:chemotaxis protein CheX
MEIGPHDLHDIVRTIWDALLGWEVQPIVSAQLPNMHGSSRTGFVQIAGAWEGAVACTSSDALLRRAAAVIFQKPPDAVTLEMVHDALGELVNMIGGNIKALLPGPSYLCLPAVVEGSDFSVCVPAARPVVEAEFLSQGQPLVVKLLAGRAPADLPERPGRDLTCQRIAEGGRSL